MPPELEQEILDLHAQDISPRQIAQFLQISMAQVRRVLQNHNLEPVLTLATKGDLPPVHQCVVNHRCAAYLLENRDRDRLPVSSLGLVTITRLKGYNHFWVCTYLIDYLCLGVKDTMGPRAVERQRYRQFLDTGYQAFPEGFREISIAQAQAIVFGAVEYAASIGFEPSPEFEQTVYHLGNWPGQPQLDFGYQGKPFYINGPFDNVRQIIRALEVKVGRGKFDYIVGIG